MFHVMIVDDEISVLEGLAYTIPWDKLDVDQVYQAESAYEALELLRQHHVDIVITDIRMPGMSGLELARDIREHWSGVRCIILTGHDEFDYAREALRADTTDYLLKPVHEEELLRAVRNVQEKLKEEWARIAEQHETEQTLREHMPLLRNKLLEDLLHGRTLGRETAERRLERLKLSFAPGDAVVLLFVRLEDGFWQYQSNGLTLLEYAVCNITEEIFGKSFDVWCYFDEHSYLIFAMKEKMQSPGGGEERQQLIERLAAQLQQSVQTYLKGSVSIMLSRWGRFPDDLHALYESSLSYFRRRIGSDAGFFYSMADEREPEEAETEALDELYRLPSMLNLLDSGKWDEAQAKLAAVCSDLEARRAASSEHLLETFHLLSATFYHFAHKNGMQLDRLTEEGERLSADMLRSVAQLRDWAARMLQRFRQHSESNLQRSRSRVLQKVKAYIDANLGGDVSLQAIADHVHFHPVYLSKLYKQETGEALSEYIHRIRMEKAVYLLKETDAKVYEIAGAIGYEITYFNKVFKKQFRMTPQEFRGQ